MNRLQRHAVTIGLSIRRTTVLAIAAIFVLVEPTSAQHPVAEAQIHLREAGEFYRDGDFDAFTRSLEIAIELNPGSYATRYNLACGYARTGRDEEALSILEQLALSKFSTVQHEGDLIAVQNGIEPWRLIRISLNQELTAVTAVRVIELANDSITPTTGAMANHSIFR